MSPRAWCQKWHIPSVTEPRTQGLPRHDPLQSPNLLSVDEVQHGVLLATASAWEGASEACGCHAWDLQVSLRAAASGDLSGSSSAWLLESQALQRQVYHLDLFTKSSKLLSSLDSTGIPQQRRHSRYVCSSATFVSPLLHMYTPKMMHVISFLNHVCVCVAHPERNSMPYSAPTLPWAPHLLPATRLQHYSIPH